ncbi:hypothetical protein EUX98_g2996 [Antrodiella citrinella]|uniref:Origin recognition complex subunit 2 n=1 Tax=Antrodiella citrinella TaxID=2447956 RepID=A0A4S4MXL1_9APHY|nr:hypothetical protein EUX98_g2996 [Antrodiella citrinella]
MAHSEREGEGSSSDSDAEVGVPGFEDSTGPLFCATAFDNYFTQASKPSRTSANVFSAETTPLSPQEYSAAISTFLLRPPPVPTPALTYDAAFRRYLAQLHQGFNLLLYGAGSKRRVLNAFALFIHNAQPAHVLVINGTAPGFDYKDLLSSIDGIPDVSSIPVLQRGVEGQMARISSHFHDTVQRQLYLIIHNIDAAPFRPLKAASVLTWLCAKPRIHVLASVDNIAFPVKYSLGVQSTQRFGASRSLATNSSAWLWHDATTLHPYDFELSHVDRSSLTGASQNASSSSRAQAATNQLATLLSSDAARHILLSVTEKAKKLFALLGARQLASMDDGEASNKDSSAIGMEYSTLFSLARENFVATNDTALRALMSEFKDHGLVVSTAQTGGAGEMIWIPLRRKALSDLLVGIEQGQL